MNRRAFLHRAALGLAWGTLPRPARASNAPPGSGSGTRELIRDPRFQSGFRLVDPTPSRRVVYGRLGTPPDTEPAWDLDQWSSRFPLSRESTPSPSSGLRRWANDGKSVVLDGRDSTEADLELAVFASSEYQGRARRSGEPWVHLLVEQTFADPPSLARLRSARFRIETRLTRAEFQRTPDYSPGLHAAQFQLFLMLQNRNRTSSGHGRLVWFGIPLYDDRSRFPKEHLHQDTGGTDMFIFSPAGETYSRRSAHDRDWISVDTELVPLFHHALETAWRRGFLRESRDLADYHVTGMNLGWEVPGLFDVAAQVRGLGLAVTTTVA